MSYLPYNGGGAYKFKISGGKMQTKNRISLIYKNLYWFMLFGLLFSVFSIGKLPSAHAQGGGDNSNLTKREVNLSYKINHPMPGIRSVSITSIQNPGFENGADGAWTEYSAHGWPIIVDSTQLGTVVTPHNGQWAAWLGGELDDISSISQTVAITQQSSTLKYWKWIGSQDVCGYDFGRILINGSAVYSFDLCTSTNTNGWVTETLDLTSYIGQNVELTFLAETDGSNNSNLFIDDVTLGGESFVFLPLIFKNYCSFQYFDDFSTQTGRWTVRDDADINLSYVGGEYQMLLKKTNLSWWQTPDLVLPNDYRIEVDAYQSSTAKENHGVAFGLRYGQCGNELNVYPPAQEYLLGKWDMNGNYTKLIDWTKNWAINQNTSNHLRVDRVGTLIRLYINGVQVNSFTDASFTGAGRDAGLIVYSGDSAPINTHFDNFSATCSQ
jgi:hypothetical protein